MTTLYDFLARHHPMKPTFLTVTSPSPSESEVEEYQFVLSVYSGKIKPPITDIWVRRIIIKYQIVTKLVNGLYDKSYPTPFREILYLDWKFLLKWIISDLVDPTEPINAFLDEPMLMRKCKVYSTVGQQIELIIQSSYLAHRLYDHVRVPKWHHQYTSRKDDLADLLDGMQSLVDYIEKHIVPTGCVYDPRWNAITFIPVSCPL